MNRLISWTLSLSMAVGLLANTTLVQGAELASSDAKLYESTVNKAIEFLRANQAADGSFSAEGGPAVTALVTAAVLQAGRSPDDPLVAKALKYVEGFVHPDGGIYANGSTHQNYETCIAMQCFTAANGDKRYDKLIAECREVRARLAVGRRRRATISRASTTAAPATAARSGPTCRTPRFCSTRSRASARVPMTRP